MKPQYAIRVLDRELYFTCPVCKRGWATTAGPTPHIVTGDYAAPLCVFCAGKLARNLVAQVALYRLWATGRITLPVPEA